MDNRAEAFILQTQSGQWTVEVWVDDVLIQCVAGLQTESDAVDAASNLAVDYGGMAYVIKQAIERPSR